MPNYNGSKYLERSILGFIKEGYKAKELIIVDSKSTDDSHKIISKYADGKIIRWVKEKDSSLSDAINIGLKYCTGDFIGYLGCDDILLQDSLTHAAELLSVINNIDGFMFDSWSYFPESRKAYYHNVPYAFNKDNLLNHYNFIGLQNIFFRSDLYKQYTFDPKYKYAMDYELYLRMLSDHNLFMLHIPMPSTINISDGNLSSNSIAGKNESDKIIAKHKTLAPSKAESLWKSIITHICGIMDKK